MRTPFLIEYKWKNIFVLFIFFSIGIFSVEIHHEGMFLIPAFLLSHFIAPDKEDNETYFCKKELQYYDVNYYPAFYRLLLSASWIWFGFSEQHLITIDIVFFSIWFASLTFYFHATFFISQDGEVPVNHLFLAKFAGLFGAIINLTMFIWFVINFDGVSWFSSVITSPFAMFFDAITSNNL